jgi:hypothetical protein
MRTVALVLAGLEQRLTRLSPCPMTGPLEKSSGDSGQNWLRFNHDEGLMSELTDTPLSPCATNVYAQ